MTPQPLSNLLDHHTIVMGATDSGKSTMVDYLAMKSPYTTITYDLQHERKTGHLCKDNLDNLRTHLTFNDIKKYKKILLYSPLSIIDKRRELAHIQDMLFSIGKALHKPRVVWVVLCITEAHNLARKHEEDTTLDTLAREGHRHGISLVIDTQRPTQLSHTVLTQVHHQIIFRLSKYEYPYFKEYKIPIEDYQEHLKQDYHFILIDNKDNIKPYPPIDITKIKGLKK